METICKRKSRIKKNNIKNKFIKLSIVFGPALFLLLVYVISAIALDYNTANQHSRLGYNEKVNGLLNMVKGKDEPLKQTEKDLLGVTEQE